MRKIVVVDIDGTLADGNHRLHHLYPKENRDWDAFYARVKDDTPHQDVIELVDALNCSNFYQIYLLTGRREETREATIEWLSRFNVEYRNLIMRPSGHYEDDHIWKPRVITEIGTHRIAFVLEDRNRVVKAIRDLGVRVLQVAPGDF